MLSTAIFSQLPAAPIPPSSISLCLSLRPGRLTSTDCTAWTSSRPRLGCRAPAGSPKVRGEGGQSTPRQPSPCISASISASTCVLPSLWFLVAPYPLGSGHNLSSLCSPTHLSANAFLLFLLPGHLTTPCQFPQPRPYL